MLLNNGADICGRHLAVPSAVRHDPHRWPRTTLPLTFTAANPQVGGTMLLKRGQHLLRTAANARAMLANGHEPSLGGISWSVSHSYTAIETVVQDNSNLAILPGGWWGKS
jgi:hypothetical protein